MRFGALPALAVLGASLVVASPIRVVVTEVSTSDPIRYGHAASNIAHIPVPPPEVLRDAGMLHALPVTPINSQTMKVQHRPGCKGMRGKALEASNLLRQWLGLEPISVEPAPPHMHHAHHEVPATTTGVIVKFKEGKTPHGELPVLPFVGTPVKPAFVTEGEVLEGGSSRPMWVHRHHRLSGSFLRRVHHALMSLGPWEGRAVAFVLGCGIGVLLRMVWVMVLVTARAIRGSRDDETDYDVVFDEAEAEMLVPPPQYTVIQGTEAVPVAVDEKAEKN
ncbi:hypothetical protein C8Q76DRAFT_51058 [Earliella scabrosa]|nr:hypothetical protein C8Q76DRAFT_51058 [Earliella scabrosa]